MRDSGINSNEFERKKTRRSGEKMEMTEKKYVVGDLKSLIGKKVKRSQLEDIYNVHMILVDAVDLPNNNCEGKLVYADGVSGCDYDQWLHQSKPITPIYNNAEELEDLVVYHE